MGKAIKGITIEIEGRSSGLVRSLKEVDSEIQKTKNGLKEVEKALKLDPKNLDLLKAKQNLLNDEIKQTEEKLRLEREAAEKAAEALAQGTITQGEYDTLQAEIVQTEQALEQLHNEANKNETMMSGIKSFSESMTEAGEKITSVGDKIKGLGESVNAVSQQAQNFLRSTTAAAQELDGALDNIARGTGATGTQLANMEEIAHELFTTMPTDMNTVSNAIAGVNTRFKLTDDELKNTTREFLKFSSVTGADVTNAINTTSSALNTWGMEASDVTGYLDLLVKVSQNTGANVDTLNNAITANAYQFQQMGFSIEDAAYFLGQVDQSGAEVSQVMGGLNKALKNATNDGLSLDDALDQLQKSLADNTDETEALNLAYDLFGAKSGPAILQAVRSGQVSFEALGSTMTDVEGALDSTYNTTIDGSEQVQIAMNSVKDASAEFGAEVLEDLAPALVMLAEDIHSATEWWKSLDDSTQNNIVGAVAVVAALGPVITTIGTVISSVGSLVTTIGTISGTAAGGTAAIGGLGAGAGAAAAGPIALLIAAIGLFAYAMYDVYQKRDAWQWGFEQLWIKIKEGFEALKNAFLAGVDWIKSKFEEWKNAGETVRTAMTNVWNDVKNGFLNLKNSATTWGKDLIDNFTSGIRSKVDSVKNTVSNVAQTVRDYLGFSEPKEGPLSNFHTYSPDMIDLWNEGINKNLSAVSATASDMASVVAGNVAPDYSGQLSTISGALAGGSQIVVPVYIGTEKLDTVIAQSSQRMSFIGGGH